MADSNTTALRVAKETSFGVAPSNPVFKEIRRTSDALGFTPTNEVTNEIDATRQVNDLINTGRDSGGDMAMELSIENMDSFMEGLFCNPWLRTPEVVNGAHYEYGASATRITAVSATAITMAATSVLSGSTINATGAVFSRECSSRTRATVSQPTTASSPSPATLRRLSSARSRLRPRLPSLLARRSSVSREPRVISSLRSRVALVSPPRL
jgi:hypothetical protein